MGETAREIIVSAVSSFPAMSATATEVLQLLNTQNSNAADIERAVKPDPGLTANLLKMANSAYFGVPGTINSVSAAVSRLGWTRMYQLVLAAAVNALLNRPVPGYDLPRGELWRQAIAGAATAQTIADRTGRKGADEAFTAALLRDIGKLIIADHIDAYY